MRHSIDKREQNPGKSTQRNLFQQHEKIEGLTRRTFCKLVVLKKAESHGRSQKSGFALDSGQPVRKRALHEQKTPEVADLAFFGE